MNRLAEKVAVITGASSGIGEATAGLFAREGARVVLVARREERLAAVAKRIEEAGGRALAVVGDVTSAADCAMAFNKAIERFGGVDVMVNNAGIVDFHTPVIRTDEELWHRVIEVNLTGTFLFCREALKHMVPRQHGVIVNVSSIAGVYGNGGAAYSAAKFGVMGLTRNIAIQYAGTGIRCHAVCPGPTPTELNAPEQMQHFDREFMEICARHTDMSVGDSDPIDQANAILFLASDEARHLTGQVLVVDRGMCL